MEIALCLSQNPLYLAPAFSLCLRLKMDPGEDEHGSLPRKVRVYLGNFRGDDLPSAERPFLPGRLQGFNYSPCFGQTI